MMYVLFLLNLIFTSVYTWGFVDANAPFIHAGPLYELVHTQRTLSGGMYAVMLASLSFWYGYLWHGVVRKTISMRQLCLYFGILIGVLFVSFPAFSNDIFNYIATAKVTYAYHENPYIVMPLDIPNEPMLRFLQAANKTALYGPTWILITSVPHVLGFGNLLVSMYAFKLTAVVFYVLLLFLIWSITRRITAVVFFGFNPLVVIDTLVDAHNDVVMMGFALGAFYALKRRWYVLATVCLAASILVKGATLFLIPVFLYAGWEQMRKAVDWERVWTIASFSMFAIFLLSPLREEIYSWYFIWPLAFLALRQTFDVISVVALGFTFGLPLRFFPFVLTREWTGMTPMIKKIVTVVPPVVAGLGYAAFSGTKRNGKVARK